MTCTWMFFKTTEMSCSPDLLCYPYFKPVQYCAPESSCGTVVLAKRVDTRDTNSPIDLATCEVIAVYLGFLFPPPPIR